MFPLLAVFTIYFQLINASYNLLNNKPEIQQERTLNKRLVYKYYHIYATRIS